MPQLLTRPAFWLAAYLVLMNLVTFWVYGAGTSAGAFPPFSFSNWLPAAPYGT